MQTLTDSERLLTVHLVIVVIYWLEHNSSIVSLSNEFGGAASHTCVQFSTW